MRPILLILMIPLIAMMAGCASDGDEAKSEGLDPLVAMYHRAETESLAQQDQSMQSSDDPQPGPAAQDDQEEDSGAIGQNGAMPQTGGSIPGPGLEPRHQSLFYESSPLSSDAEQPSPKPETVQANQANHGDPLLGTYHRRIIAAPLSDDLAQITDEQASYLLKEKPAAASQPAAPESGNQNQAIQDNQTGSQASLHLRPMDETPLPEKKPFEQSESEPVLSNPPIQAPQLDAWIERVDLIEAKGQIIVEVQLSGKISPKIYMLDEDGDHPMLVLDFPGVTGRSFPNRISAPPSVASAIRMANHPKKAQIIVDLIPKKDYEVQPAWLKGQHTLMISISLI